MTPGDGVRQRNMAAGRHLVDVLQLLDGGGLRLEKDDITDTCYITGPCGDVGHLNPALWASSLSLSSGTFHLDIRAPMSVIHSFSSGSSGSSVSSGSSGSSGSLWNTKPVAAIESKWRRDAALSAVSLTDTSSVALASRRASVDVVRDDVIRERRLLETLFNTEPPQREKRRRCHQRRRGGDVIRDEEDMRNVFHGCTINGDIQINISKP
ncbi:hypothetical protein EYF80_061952 [Liparis tanakae]|uniref:Uncharacterized protein n=1 Tax=Liparis tanakae TaxID=230148 RepID=A0A4Z2EHS4_9TELE|nr:hypothetical protein EYF80_061952 [Liparis tanakae]